MTEVFRRYAEVAANAAGSIWEFLLASLAVSVWVITGPYFGYAD